MHTIKYAESLLAAREAEEAAMQCECGAWSGAACEGELGADAVTVEWMPEEWMPEYLRASHEAAAGNMGVYPVNGARRIRVTPECAEMMLDVDGEWCSLVPQ